MSLPPENSDGLGVAARKISRSPPHCHPQRLAPLPKSGVSGQILDKGADPTTLGQWLRGQTKARVLARHRINADGVDWASQQAQPGRWQHGGEGELFFDDTQIEVEGHKLEGARINYEGNRALGWQTLG